MVWLILTVAVVTALMWRLFLTYPPRPAGVRYLTGRESAIVAAAADAMFPRGGKIAESGVEAEVVPYLDLQFGLVSNKNRRLMRLLFLFIELSPLLFGPRRVRFTRLSVDEQTSTLRRAAGSKIYFYRLSFLSLRTLLCLGYLANQSVNAQLECIPNMRPYPT
jgi:hypothetical protein